MNNTGSGSALRPCGWRRAVLCPLKGAILNKWQEN